MKLGGIFYCTLLSFFIITQVLMLQPNALAIDEHLDIDKDQVKELDLDQCTQTALDNNHRRRASLYAVRMAEAQHRQTLAAYWPQMTFRGAYLRLDAPPNFLSPASDITLPMGATIPITIPGVGMIPVNSLAVPAQDIKLMDRDVYRAAVDATWLIYDGGMRKGYGGQTQGLVRTG